MALIEGGTVYYIRADHIGRPVFATSSAGVKVWEATYLPFGGVHTSAGNLPANRFPGQWFQSESGLHQNWMRDYDPTTGRYLEPDPLGLVDGASVYGYAKQNPGRSIDPKGLQVITLPFPGASAGAGIGTGLGGTIDIAPPVIDFSTGLRTESQQEQSDREYNRYKDFCDHMGPGSPPDRTADPEAYCRWLASALSQASECIHRIREFDRRWSSGRHDHKINDWVNRLKWLSKEQNTYCSNCSVPSVPPVGFGLTDPVHDDPILYYCDLSGRCVFAI